MLKLSFVTSSTFSCLIAETICVCFSAGGAAVAEVAAFPVVLPSAVGDLVSAVGDLVSAVGDFVSAVGFFMSLEWVVESDAFDLLSVLVSAAVLPSAGDFVSAVGFFMSFEWVAGAVESDAFVLLSGFISPVVFASGLPCAPAPEASPLS